MEEMNQKIEIIEHFYTTDYFQPAFFFEHNQLISIYYIAKLIEPLKFRISTVPFDFPELKNGSNKQQIYYSGVWYLYE